MNKDLYGRKNVLHELACRRLNFNLLWWRKLCFVFPLHNIGYWIVIENTDTRTGSQQILTKENHLHLWQKARKSLRTTFSVTHFVNNAIGESYTHKPIFSEIVLAFDTCQIPVLAYHSSPLLNSTPFLDSWIRFFTLLVFAYEFPLIESLQQ